MLDSRARNDRADHPALPHAPEFDRPANGRAARRNRGGRAALWGIALGAAGLTGGCADPNPPLSAEHQAPMRRIAVLVTGQPERIGAVRPVAGEGAAGASAVGQTLAGGFCSGSAGVFIVSVLATPIAAAVGSSRSRTAAEVATAEKSLAAALVQISPHEKIRDALLVISVPGKPLHKSEGSSSPQDLAAAHAKGIDTVLEISLRRYGFITSGQIDPDLYAAVGAEVRVLRTRDGAELHRRRLGGVAAARKYFELAANDGAGVAAAFAEAYSNFADNTVRLTFGETAASAPRPRSISAPIPETLRFFDPERHRKRGLCD